MAAPVLGALVRPPARRAAAGDGGPALVERLAGLDEAGRARLLLDLVCDLVATVLGQTGRAAPDRAFVDLGFDSLTAVELRNRLASATGLRLSATLAFDHPTPASLAAFVGSELAPEPAEPADPGEAVLAELDRLSARLAEIRVVEARAAGAQPGGGRAGEEITRAIASRLRAMAAELTAPDAAGLEMGGRIQSANRDEIFDFIDRNLGRSLT
jgi:acyl carrier protein